MRALLARSSLLLMAAFVAIGGVPRPVSAASAPAVRACEAELRTKVHAKHPASGRVEVTPDTIREQKKGEGRLAIRGAGRVETRNAGWRRLTFECAYDTRAGTATSLRFEIAAAGGSGTQDAPAHVCKRAVARRIHDAHPASGKIRWSVPGLSERPVGNGQTHVSGNGRIQTRHGDWRRFTFTCTYDGRSGRATQASAKF